MSITTRDRISSARIIRKPELLRTLSLSDATVWRLERDGKFPRRIQLGGNSVGWLEAEVLAWVEARKAERADHQLSL